MGSKYKHQPLKSQRSIRIFTILPSRDCKAPIYGTLSEVDLDSNPSFEALSYVWGNPEPGSAVTIHTQSTGGTEEASCLEITPNCLSALHILRFRLKPRRLWIDAMCIDQTSTAERGQQVPLIAGIYGRAQQVLVWLNPGDQNKKRVQQTSKLLRYVGWLQRMRLLRLYETDEHADSRMPKNTKLVMACERYVDSDCRKLGGKSRPLLVIFSYFSAQVGSSYSKNVRLVQCSVPRPLFSTRLDGARGGSGTQHTCPLRRNKCFMARFCSLRTLRRQTKRLCEEPRSQD